MAVFFLVSGSIIKTASILDTGTSPHHQVVFFLIKVVFSKITENYLVREIAVNFNK